MALNIYKFFISIKERSFIHSIWDLFLIQIHANFIEIKAEQAIASMAVQYHYGFIWEAVASKCAI